MQAVKFTAKDVLPFLKRIGVTAANTVSTGAVADTLNLRSWADRMNAIQSSLGSVTDEKQYNSLVTEYNGLLDKYQQTYNAAAQVISVLDELLDVTINGMGAS
jgi:predicted  nucleic acid-binding Zn-ribbon protein